MLTVICPECGKAYRLPDDYAGKRVRCPGCTAVFKADGDQAEAPLRVRLREELAQLAAGGAPPEEPSEEPKLRVAERERRTRGRGRLLPAVVLVLLLACAGAGGMWVHLRGRGGPQLPQNVRAALSRAQRSDVAGGELEALADWQAARRLMLSHRGSPESFQDELRKVEDRIAQLARTVRRRQGGLPAQQEMLEQARSALEAGRLAEAKGKLEELLADLGKADAADADLASLRKAAEELLADPRFGPTERPQAPEAAAAAPRRTGRAEPAASPAERLNQRIEAVHQSSARGERVVVIDEPSGFQRWHGESWADPVTLGLERQPGTGKQVIALRQQDGDNKKWVMSIDQPLDLRLYDVLTVDVQVSEPVAISLAVWTQPGNVIFESRAQTVRKGQARRLSFELKGEQFKSQTTNWQFGTEIQNPANVIRITLFIYGRSKDSILIRNLRLVKNA